jgi:hypothetical protein
MICIKLLVFWTCEVSYGFSEPSISLYGTLIMLRLSVDAVPTCQIYEQTSGADIKHAIRKTQYHFSSLFMCMSYPEIGCTFFVGWGKVLLPYNSYNYSVVFRKNLS